MNDEIKEILEKLKDNIPIEEYRSEGTSDGLTHYEEDKDSWQYKLLDYITNLQEENEDLKDRLKVMEHFKNSLLEENEKLKEQKKKAIEYINKAVNNPNNTILPSGKITDLGYCIPALEDLKIILGGDEE